MTFPQQSSYLAVPAIGIEGLLEGDRPRDVLSMKNAEASASMPVGQAVAFKVSGPTSDYDAIQMVDASSKVAGIVAHTESFATAWTANGGTIQGDFDATGIRPGVFLNVLRKGKILVKCMTGCVPGDRLFIAFSTSGVYTAKGQLGNADASSNTIDSSKQGQWLTTATAGGLAWLDVDFINKP